MDLRKKGLGFFFAAAYLLIVTVAFLFVLFMMMFNPSKSEFSGLYLIITTLPWSLFLTQLLDRVGMQDSIPILLKLMLLMLFGVLNAIFLYLFGSCLDRKVNNSSSDKLKT